MSQVNNLQYLRPYFILCIFALIACTIILFVVSQGSGRAFVSWTNSVSVIIEPGGP